MYRSTEQVVACILDTLLHGYEFVRSNAVVVFFHVPATCSLGGANQIKGLEDGGQCHMDFIHSCCLSVLIAGNKNLCQSAAGNLWSFVA